MKADVRERPSAASAHPDRAVSTTTILDYAGIACLAAVMAIHTTELAGKTEEVAYLGFGYVLLVAASLVSVVLLAQRDVRGWYLGGAACAATIVGYVLTRTTGLPRSHDDVGNWSETIAIWALLAEALMVVLSAVAIRRARRS